MQYQRLSADPLLSIWRRRGGPRGDTSHVSGCVGCVSGHVGLLPLLKCYAFQGFARIRVFHVDGELCSNFHGLGPACLPNLSVRNVWRASALGFVEPLGGNTSRTQLLYNILETDGILTYLMQRFVKPMQYQRLSADPLLSIWRRRGGPRGGTSHVSGHVGCGSGHVGLLPLLKC